MANVQAESDGGSRDFLGGGALVDYLFDSVPVAVDSVQKHF